jgi:hypothetical protein
MKAVIMSARLNLLEDSRTGACKTYVMATIVRPGIPGPLGRKT